MALVARALLQEIGITVEVEARDGGGFWSAGRGDAGRDIEMYMTVFNGKLDPNFLMQWFVSSQIGTWNWQRFASPEFDALFAQAAADWTRRGAGRRRSRRSRSWTARPPSFG
jgi:peptide/nickel transport system substrate-binding protein